MAVWRCQDCALAEPLCRLCIRTAHTANPFHKIQKWTGRYFRAAELWEVGNYILVPHRAGVRYCSGLNFKISELEKVQCQQDAAEQQTLQTMTAAQDTADVHMYDGDEDLDAAAAHAEDEAREAAAVDAFIEQLHADNVNGTPHPNEDLADVEANDQTFVGQADDEINALPIYLMADADGHGHIPTADALQHPYVRVVHTNGLHHLALVSCSCCEEGPDGLPLDLMACRLVPASFQRIRSLFTAQMLDYFRLCNLELKASAYQFYQLLRRLTLPTAPSQVVNLYNELRRMSRLWRWLKRLKWNGFGHNGRDPMDVEGGELAVYCPACPQPGINIPANWKDEKENKFIYRRMFVTDGNFKADHVRQDKAKGDYWLSEGGGMDPRYEDYKLFLRDAIEKPTVSRPSQMWPRIYSLRAESIL